MKRILTILAILVLVGIPLLAFSLPALADTEPASMVNDDVIGSEGINANTAHNTFYAAGRHWVMYTWYDDVFCDSSADYGATWNQVQVTDGAQTVFRGFACWYDEPTNIVHWARVEQGNVTTGDIIYHWAATPLADGTLSYIGNETPVEESTDAVVFAVTIACDELSRPYIAWTENEYTDELGNLTGYYWPEVDASTENDGTWNSVEAFEEFDNTTIIDYGHDYDTLFDGNWSCAAVNLVPVGSGNATMQLSWSVADVGNSTAGIDSTVFYSLSGGYPYWGNCSWIVPVDDTYGLTASIAGMIAFSAYDMDEDIHFVYTNDQGHVMYNFKDSTESWDDINGAGNWTLIKDVDDLAFPAIAGYATNGAGEDLIVVVNIPVLGSLWYDINPYGPAPFTGTWTEIWEVPTPSVDFTFLHSLQYKYGAGSPVGFAWEWGDFVWDDDGTSGNLDYWWIDKDGTIVGENPLGYHYVASSTSVLPSSTKSLLEIVSIILFALFVGRVFQSNEEDKGKRIMVAGILLIVWITVIETIINTV